MLIREVMMLQDVGPELVDEGLPAFGVGHNVGLVSANTSSRRCISWTEDVLFKWQIICRTIITQFYKCIPSIEGSISSEGLGVILKIRNYQKRAICEL